MVQGCCEPWPGMLRGHQSCMALNVALPGALGVVWVFGRFPPASTASLTFCTNPHSPSAVRAAWNCSSQQERLGCIPSTPLSSKQIFADIS